MFHFSVAEKVLSQTENDSNKLEVLFTFGIGVQSFTDVFFIDRKYEQIQSSVYMDGSFNSEGLGLPLGIKAYNSNRNVGISYEPVIRYDVIDTEAFLAHKAGRVSTKVERKLFADHHFSIYRKFRFSRTAEKTHRALSACCSNNKNIQVRRRRIIFNNSADITRLPGNGLGNETPSASPQCESFFYC